MLGSIGLIMAAGMAIVSLSAGIPLLAGAAGIVMIGIVVDIILAHRRPGG
ncbi:hypothetical protein [Nonomuraea turkmeniaca]|nr:hypothetical protein [Nonomuraea turkmeniaca]